MDFFEGSNFYFTFTYIVFKKQTIHPMKQILLLIFIVQTALIFGQIQGDGGKSTDWSSLQSTLPVVQFLQPDIKALQAEDAKNDRLGEGPWRFGYNNETSLTLNNSGTWLSLPNGGKLWLLQLECVDATTVNLTLEKTQIPEGNALFVYNPNKSFILGKFTQKHIYNGQLGTELIPGSKVIVEYYVAPENNDNQGELTIATVTHGYRTAEEFQEKAFGQSGACHKNVNCPEGTPFANQKRSVVMLVSGSNGFCTGALVNNTAYDGKPYVLTANHCYSNPASWVFRFNWESPDCNNPGSSPSFTSMSGAVLRARRSTSDFCLVEITGGLESGTVPAAYNAYFSGWDKTGENPTSTFGIHHPKGDIKKISFDDQQSVPAQTKVGSVVSDVNGTWRVQWDRNTTTEGGSSGSPLFNQHKRIIGQLWGGQASCSNTDGFDYYGRFSISWNPTGSDSSTQLKYWLDPSNTGALVVNGYQPGESIQLDGSLVNLKNVSGTVCDAVVEPKITLVNTGQTTLTSATITYGLDGVENQTYNWSGNLTMFQSQEITLPTITATAGGHSFSATITNVNGGSDEVVDNNKMTSNFYVVTNPNTVTLDVTVDCYASETSWQITNASNDTLYKSPVYYNTDEGLHTYSLCLSEGCYSFKIFDSYSDGMSYCDSGMVVIKGPMNEILGQITKVEAATFGSSKIVNFCIGDNGISSIEADFGVFPNPTSNQINWMSNDVKFVKMLDVSGKIVLQKAIATEHAISVNQLVDGVYFVEFTLTSGTSVVKKIAVKK